MIGILPIVYDQIKINEEKLKQLSITEKVLNIVELNNLTSKMKIYNTGMCIISYDEDNFNYILTLPEDYNDNYIAKKISINNDNIILTIFNNIISTNNKSYIQSKSKVKNILNTYFQYHKFIYNAEQAFALYLQNGENYKIKGESYSQSLTGSYFVTNKKQNIGDIEIKINN